ncbi:MAG: hypothetical protein AAF391_05075 [Bacteroidota bacterium]
MELKKAVIRWLLEDKPSFSTGLGLYSQCDFRKGVMQRLLIGENHESLLILHKELGRLLELDQFPLVEPILVSEQVITKIKDQKTLASKEQIDYSPTSPPKEIQLAMDLGRLREERRILANSANENQTDEKRASIWEACRTITNKIAIYHENLDRIKLGQSIKEIHPASDLNPSFSLDDIPNAAYHRLDSMKRAMSIRSKAKGNIKKWENIKESHPDGHPKRRKAKDMIFKYSAKWDQMNKYIIACQNYVESQG